MSFTTPTFIANLSDPILKVDLTNAYSANGVITQANLAVLFPKLATEVGNGTLSASQVEDLKSIANNINAVDGNNAYVTYITQALINGNISNLYFTGGQDYQIQLLPPPSTSLVINIAPQSILLGSSSLLGIYFSDSTANSSHNYRVEIIDTHGGKISINPSSNVSFQSPYNSSDLIFSGTLKNINSALGTLNLVSSTVGIDPLSISITDLTTNQVVNADNNVYVTDQILFQVCMDQTIIGPWLNQGPRQYPITDQTIIQNQTTPILGLGLKDSSSGSNSITAIVSDTYGFLNVSTSLSGANIVRLSNTSLSISGTLSQVNLALNNITVLNNVLGLDLINIQATNGNNFTVYGSDQITTLGAPGVSTTTTSNQITQLNNKWFLGSDLPSDLFVYGSSLSPLKISYYDPTTYSALNPWGVSTIFGSYGTSGFVENTINGAVHFAPSMNDVNQGGIGDCVLLSWLADLAHTNSSVIHNMISDNGNGTYGIKLYQLGIPLYITVNSILSNISSTGQYVWAALIEKAMAQLQSEGLTNTLNSIPVLNPWDNSFIQLGFPQDLFANQGNSFTYIGAVGVPTVADMTGATVITKYSFIGNTWIGTVKNSVNFSGSSIADTSLSISAFQIFLINTLLQGSDISAGFLGWYDNSGRQCSDAEEAHACSIYGYDNATGNFQLRNSWGNGQNINSQFYQTTFEASITQLLKADILIDNLISIDPIVNTVDQVISPNFPSVIHGISIYYSNVTHPLSSNYNPTITVVISDRAGLFNVPTTGLTSFSGQNTNNLSITGSLSAVNLALSSLTDTNPGNPLNSTDMINIGVTDPNGYTGTGTIGLQVASAPSISPNTSYTVNIGSASAINGLSIVDAGAGNSLMTVVISDAQGLLNATAATGISISGANTSNLTLSGKTIAAFGSSTCLAAMNQTLATLTYKNSTPSVDTLTLTTTDWGTNLVGTATISVTASNVSVVPALGAFSAGATITLLQPNGTVISVSQTDATGVVRAIGLGAYTGPFIVQVTGGPGVTVYNERTGQNEPFAANNSLLSIVPSSTNLPANGSVGVTELTNAAAAILIPNPTAPTISGSAQAVQLAITNANNTIAAAVGLPANVSLLTAPTPLSLSSPTTITATDPATILMTALLTSIANAETGSVVSNASAMAAGVAANNGSLSASSGIINTALSNLNTVINHIVPAATLNSLGTALTNLVSQVSSIPNQASISSVFSTSSAGSVHSIPSSISFPVISISTTKVIGLSGTSNNSPISFSDSSVGNSPFRVVISDANGKLNVDSAPGLSIIGANSNKLTISGFKNDVNNALASLTVNNGDSSSDYLWIDVTNLTSGVDTITGNGVVLAKPISIQVGSQNVVSGRSSPISGISINDGTANTNDTVTITDKYGLLTVTPEAGLFMSGWNTTTLSFVGTLSKVNAALATLRVNNPTIGNDDLTINVQNTTTGVSTSGIEHIASITGSLNSSFNLFHFQN